MKEYKLDKLDRQILTAFLKDSRVSYGELAKELIVSQGTIHVRLNKLKEAGIITGSKIILDYSKLGFEICAFVGVNLASAKDSKDVWKKLLEYPEVLEIHYTTGGYGLFLKVMTASTRDLHLFLSEKLQSIAEVQSTETIMSLDHPVSRDAKLI